MKADNKIGVSITVSTRLDKTMYAEMKKVQGYFLNEADFIRLRVHSEGGDSVKVVRKFRNLINALFTAEEYNKMVEETKHMP